MNPETKARGIQLGIYRCHVCGLLNDQHEQYCERCHAKITPRDYRSLQSSWALLITAAILLVPANIYPITTLVKSGVVTHETIFSGILRLVHADLLPIAVIVFTASILVPWLKILGLGFYLSAITFKMPISKQKLTTGFHIIEWIGRWSMLDLFVISLSVALVNMGQLLDAQPAPAATAFALVILFTQLAAKTLDTRLLWDQLDKNDDNS
ncbi:paraquat-inducible protein A [Shewanella sp.]|uniref:paraquat-inducible protein A n=1 Tax=Shewanella sp. TaxID=50422 RepID=UPI003A96F1B9